MKYTIHSLILGLGMLIIFVHYLLFPAVPDVDMHSLAAEGAIAVFLMLSLGRVMHFKARRDIDLLLRIGFLLLFVSLTTDAVDELFKPSAWVTTVFEDIIQVCGFIVLFAGISRWIGMNSRQKRELAELASHDFLTGAYTRRAFYERVCEEFSRCRRTGEDLYLLLMDLDHFKSVNDEHGHAAGDEALRTFAKNIAGSVRKADCLGRWGGEEFVLMPVDGDEESCRNLAEKLRRRTEDLSIRHAGRSIRLTVSIGAARSRADDAAVEAVLDRADGALYEAKQSGRNGVVLAFP